MPGAGVLADDQGLLAGDEGQVVRVGDAVDVLTIENFMNVASGFDAPSVRVWDGIKSIQMNDWSPDGSQIAYTAEIVTNASGEDRVSYLAVVEDVAMDGPKTSGSPKILSAHNTLGDRGPVFSPDGTQIAFWAWDKSYRATLWLAGSDRSGLTQLTRLGPDMTPPSGTRTAPGCCSSPRAALTWISGRSLWSKRACSPVNVNEKTVCPTSPTMHDCPSYPLTLSLAPGPG